MEKFLQPLLHFLGARLRRLVDNVECRQRFPKPKSILKELHVMLAITDHGRVDSRSSAHTRKESKVPSEEVHGGLFPFVEKQWSILANCEGVLPLVLC
jgi:hypothetical protein